MLPLLLVLGGLSTLGAGVVFAVRRRKRESSLELAHLRATGLEEQEGGDAPVYYHLVFEVVDGPHAGLRVVSELGHGKRPTLPEGIQTELIQPATSKAFTRAALRAENLMIAVFGVSGLAAFGIAAFLAAQN